ncbi:MAG: alpha/beta hydrolase [Candidatus Micrarchaeota archaeon]
MRFAPKNAKLAEAAAAPQKKFSTSSGTLLEYIHLDRGKPRTIVFFNGWMTKNGIWKLQEKSLWDFNLLFTNNRGYGQSTLDGDKPSTYLYSCARDNAELLAHLRITNPDTVAFSMGGLIATAFHHEMQAAVRSMSFVSPAVSSPLETFRFAHLVQPLMIVLERTQGVTSLFGGLRIIAKLAKTDPAVAPLYLYLKHLRKDMKFAEFAKYLNESLDLNAQASLLSLRAMFETGNDIGALLSEVKVPVFVVRGGSDSLVNEKSVELIRERVPSAMINIYEGLSHYPQIEQPKRFNQDLYEFLIKH